MYSSFFFIAKLYIPLYECSTICLFIIFWWTLGAITNTVAMNICAQCFYGHIFSSLFPFLVITVLYWLMSNVWSAIVSYILSAILILSERMVNLTPLLRLTGTGVGCHSLLQGIFPTQGSNPGLLHCRQVLYCLICQGSPIYKHVHIPKANPARSQGSALVCAHSFLSAH